MVEQDSSITVAATRSTWTPETALNISGSTVNIAADDVDVQVDNAMNVPEENEMAFVLTTSSNVHFPTGTVTPPGRRS